MILLIDIHRHSIEINLIWVESSRLNPRKHSMCSILNVYPVSFKNVCSRIQNVPCLNLQSTSFNIFLKLKNSIISTNRYPLFGRFHWKYSCSQQDVRFCEVTVIGNFYVLYIGCWCINEYCKCYWGNRTTMLKNGATHILEVAIPIDFRWNSNG